MSGWIKDDLRFEERIRCIAFSGKFLASLGLTYRAFLQPESIEKSVRHTGVFDYLPEKTAIVRVYPPWNQDAICVWFTHPTFAETQEFNCIAVEAFEDVVTKAWEKR